MLVSICGLLLLISDLGNAYFININKFYTDGKTSDSNSGFGLQRVSNEFVVDGCGSDTMLDVVTGLCWDKNMNRGGTRQWATSNGYTDPIWDNVTKVYSYPSGKANYPAFSYCEDLVLGGNDDWRMPNTNELHTLLDEISIEGQTCSRLTSFGFTNCQNSNYWTEQEFKAATSDAIFINIHPMVEASTAKTSVACYVLCVRNDY